MVVTTVWNRSLLSRRCECGPRLLSEWPKMCSKTAWLLNGAPRCASSRALPRRRHAFMRWGEHWPTAIMASGGSPANLQLATCLQELVGSCKEPPGADRVCRRVVESAGECAQCESLLSKDCVIFPVSARMPKATTFSTRESSGYSALLPRPAPHCAHRMSSTKPKGNIFLPGK